MPRRCYFEARLRQFDAIPDSFAPVLQVGISLKTSTGGFSESTDVGHDGPSQVRVEPLSIEATLSCPPTREGNVPAPSAIVAYGRPRSMRASTLQLDGGWSADYDLLFPLSPSVLSMVEEVRAGGNPEFGVTLRIAGLFRHSFSTGTPGAVPFLVPFVVDDVRVVPHDSTASRLEIEKSRWIERILPGLGVGKWMLYEIPVEYFEGSAQVDTYLNNAVRQFVAGEWKLAMAAARDVVESLERELSAEANPAFGDRYGSPGKKTREVAESYRDLVEAMLAYQAALKSLLAAGSHPERPEELVERPEAEMAVWTALALRRYVGMRLRQSRASVASTTPPPQERPA